MSGRRKGAVLLSEDDRRAIEETLHLLSIPGMRESIREGTGARHLVVALQISNDAVRRRMPPAGPKNVSQNDNLLGHDGWPR